MERLEPELLICVLTAKESLRRMEAEVASWIFLKFLDLFLELLWVGPAVVPLAEGDVNAPALIQVVQGVAHDAQILMVADVTDSACSWMLQQ